MEKIFLDNTKCFRCGACVANASENFAFEGEDVKVINEEVTEEAKIAIECCPAVAISIINE